MKTNTEQGSAPGSPHEFYSAYPALQRAFNTKIREYEYLEKKPAKASHDFDRMKVLLVEIFEIESRMSEIRIALASFTEDYFSGSAREALRLDDERVFIECHFITGLSMEATAEAMNVSRDTVYRIARRLRKRDAKPQNWDAKPQGDFAL